jgi:hypothetical protein
MLKNVADAMPLFKAENNSRGPGGCDLTTPYNPAVRPQTVDVMSTPLATVCGAEESIFTLYATSQLQSKRNFL